ncbi:hypothetical protein PHJA_000707600 [Phtheirospermum japonicum]|uniref:Uncharacterized protein n=1 Tax=Phtheirospermum japonicum TaxID=374723 RepID=A0A830BJN3_9LAMI|nr:hypothetical protein PHJA_000707600 [Phtheirospermum japonicum]
MHPAANNSHAAAPRRQIAPRPQIRSFQWRATENRLYKLTGSGQPRHRSGESEEAEGGDPVFRVGQPEESRADGSIVLISSILLYRDYLIR